MQQEMAPAATSSMPMMMEMSPPPQLRSSISDILSSKPYSSSFFHSGVAPPPLTSALISQTRTASAPNTATAAVASLSRLMSQHQDLMNRYSLVMSQLQKTFKEAETLRQENTNLRVANCELSRQVTILVHAAALQSHLQPSGGSSWSDEKKKESVGGSEEEFVESESPTSVMENQMQKDKAPVDSGRETLPKSISVRSSGFLKISPGSVSSGGSAGSSGSSSEPKLKLGHGGSSRIRADSPVSAPQKVYVRGGGQKDGPIELEVYNQGMVKTELCNKWQETGECPYGDHCQFAHGIKELRPVIRHPRYKTEVCRMILSGVPCLYGHRCHFRHALTEQEKHMLPFRID